MECVIKTTAYFFPWSKLAQLDHSTPYIYFLKVVWIFSAMDLLKTSSRVSIYNFSSWYESSLIRIFSGFSCLAQCFVNTISCMNPHIFRVWIFTAEYPWWMTIIPSVWSFSLIVLSFYIKTAEKIIARLHSSKRNVEGRWQKKI